MGRRSKQLALWLLIARDIAKNAGYHPKQVVLPLMLRQIWQAMQGIVPEPMNSQIKRILI